MNEQPEEEAHSEVWKYGTPVEFGVHCLPGMHLVPECILVHQPNNSPNSVLLGFYGGLIT